MKNRDYKQFATGGMYHIFNRGNNKDKIFYDEQDYKVFLFRVGLSIGFTSEELNANPFISLPYSRIRISGMHKGDFEICAFCLMPNHFHFLIKQCKDEPISRFVSKICTSYSMYINKKYNRVGHVFQDKFKSIPIEDDPQLMWAASYIHMNPVKDHLVLKPAEYKWSSYNDYVSERKLPIVKTNLLLDLFQDKQQFEKETQNYFKKEDIDFMSRTVLDS